MSARSFLMRMTKVYLDDECRRSQGVSSEWNEVSIEMPPLSRLSNQNIDMKPGSCKQGHQRVDREQGNSPTHKI